MRKDDLVVPQGTDWTVSWVIVDPMTNEPVEELAGWSAKSQARRAVADQDSLFTWSSTPEAGEGKIELENGRLRLVLKPTDTTPWSWRTALYDVELTSPSGAVTRISGGRISVLPEITRD